MKDRPILLVHYDAAEESADGGALARLLAGFTDSELLVTRLRENGVGAAVADPATPRPAWSRAAATPRPVLAALPDESLSAPTAPVLGPLIRRELHELARSTDARLLVLGSTAAALVDQAPCPVAVAPPLFRVTSRILPERVGCAYDGTVSSIDALLTAADLAVAIPAPLSVMSVAGRGDAARHCDDAAALVRESAGVSVEVECVALEGDPATALIAEADKNVGLLVVGSRALGPVRRALLGSVSTQVLRSVSCPVIVVPRRR